PGVLTSWKTSHGPQKSIITAPSETKKATGMLPWAGGLIEFALGAVLLPSKLLVASAGAELAERSPTTESAIIATNPSFAALSSSSLPIIAFVCSFMAFRFSDQRRKLS